MTDFQVFEKALEKAGQNGFALNHRLMMIIGGAALTGKEDTIADLTRGVVFSRAFAKAFWNSNETVQFFVKDASPKIRQEHPEWDEFGTTEIMLLWEYYLQEMISEENPIQYLAKFL